MLCNMTTPVQFVDRPGGRVAVEVQGSGPLVLCIPGMGDLRSEFRHLAPRLVAAGHRVAVMDLRGHGDSSLFEAYGDALSAEDALAVVASLGAGPATIIGNSMGAAAAVIAAATAPQMVSRIVLIGPFVRDSGFFGRLAFRVALLRPWGPAVWRKYYASLFPTGLPTDLGAHRKSVAAALRRPSRWRAFQRTAAGSHAAAEAALPSVGADTLVVMGEKDRDFSNPEAEARWVAEQLHGHVQMIPEAGHYPMAERPELVLDVVVPFLQSALTRR